MLSLKTVSLFNQLGNNNFQIFTVLVSILNNLKSLLERNLFNSNVFKIFSFLPPSLPPSGPPSSPSLAQQLGHSSEPSFTWDVTPPTEHRWGFQSGAVQESCIRSGTLDTSVRPESATLSLSELNFSYFWFYHLQIGPNNNINCASL